MTQDCSGKRFGKLVVLERSSIKHGHQYWKLKCDCGNIIERVIHNISKNIYNSCSNCRKNSNSHAWLGYGELPKDIFNTIRNSAAQRNIEFNITIEELWILFQKQQGKCALTGWEINFNSSYRDKTKRTASLDRIDSSKGYSIDNIQWVHRIVNYAKRNTTQENFISMCKDITENIKKI